jgi:hypothetical protein
MVEAYDAAFLPLIDTREAIDPLKSTGRSTKRLSGSPARKLAVAACLSHGARQRSRGYAHGGQVLWHGERNIEDQDVSVVVSGACLGVTGVDADEVLA